MKSLSDQVAMLIVALAGDDEAAVRSAADAAWTLAHARAWNGRAVPGAGSLVHAIDIAKRAWTMKAELACAGVGGLVGAWWQIQCGAETALEFELERLLQEEKTEG